MTDITKYRNVSLTHDTYKTLISLSKVLLPDATLSISKTIESIKVYVCPTCKGNGYVKVACIYEKEDMIHQCWDCESQGEIYDYENEDLPGEGMSIH